MQLSESFVRVARLNRDSGQTRLGNIKEASSADMASKRNPLLQIAKANSGSKVKAITSLALEESVYQEVSFDQIGFSTLVDFIAEDETIGLSDFELGIFQQSNGQPAPTASPAAIDLVFCGFKTNLLPELSESFPNLDSEPTSLSLSLLDQVRILSKHCTRKSKVLLLELGKEFSWVVLINNKGMQGSHRINIGKERIYQLMAESLELQYTGSAIKLFSRSNFDSEELSPVLGNLFAEEIKPLLGKDEWNPSAIHVAGLMSTQDWLQEAIAKALSLKTYMLDVSKLSYGLQNPSVCSSDIDLLVSVQSYLTRETHLSWNADFLPNLAKSNSLPRKVQFGSVPPFPAAHIENVHSAGPIEEAPIVAVEETPVSEDNYLPVSHEESISMDSQETDKADPGEKLPDHLLSSFEEFDDEFESDEDFSPSIWKRLLVITSVVGCFLLAVGIIILLGYPEVAERYLGIEITSQSFTSRETGGEQRRDPKEFGILIIYTQPSECAVTVDGMEPMTSPVVKPNFPTGTHSAVISKKGYKDAVLTFDIIASQTNQPPRVVLEPLD